MKYPDYKPKEVEPLIVNFWKSSKVLDKLQKRNKKGKKYYFLQGPPYTSGRIHLGQAWNNSMKDSVLRYKRMNGFNVWNRAGYDMHGLPTEHKVMQKFKLRTKQDIINFGVEKFSEECYNFSTEMAGLMSQDFERLGITLDFSDPYLPVKNEFMEAEWFLIKKAHEQGRLYLGKRTLHWCANCETALAKHECEYNTITDNSIFVKFPVKGKQKEYLVIWTTTPWTLALNLAVMANPKVDYVKAKADGETWIVAEALVNAVGKAAEKELKITEKFTGDKLDGLEYDHPWAKEIDYASLKKESKRVHTVVMSEEYVTTDSGSGLVHCAPGCGPEDYEVGHFYHIKPFNNINERGVFPDSMGRFSGLVAKKDDKAFIEALKETGNLVAQASVEHEYAHCQRCHKPVIFRTTEQWFFKIEDLREKMLQANASISWVPDAGKRAFTSWLENLRDNSITKQRFWGTPVPIWTCGSCDRINVFGSIAELKKKAKKIPKNIHKPWIDEVTFACECGGVQKRVPDILDVWIDAGTTSWSCLNYPKDKKLFEQWYPADFILEGKDQIRGWFNLLMIASFLAFDRPSFKAVYMHGFVTDVEGVKMSKSLGNIISPYEVIDKYSADVLRYYMSQTAAGEDINFSWDEVGLKHRYLNVLWNIHKLLFSLTSENDINPFKLDHEVMQELLDVEERFIFSKLNRTIKEVTSLYEAYRIDEVIKPIEELYLDLSRTYVQLVRDKSSVGSKQDKEVVMYTISHVLFESLKLFAPVAPFVTETIYQNMRDEYKLKQDSIHLYEWPKYDEKLVDTKLENAMAVVQQAVQAGLNAREKLKINVRWPMAEAVVVTSDDMVLESVETLREVMKRQLNVKNVQVLEKLPGVRQRAKPDFAKLNPKYPELTPKIIAKLATESAETILGHIDKHGSYSFEIEGENVSVSRDDLIVERDVPANYTEAEFSKGFVYMDHTRTPDLEAEGYARELMRRVQALRKDAGLQKADRINLYVKVSSGLRAGLEKFLNDLAQKCGAEKCAIGTLEPARKHEHVSNEKIKDENFEVCFDKV